MDKLRAWLKQPSTITGLAGFAATAVGLIAHYATHDTTLTVTLGLLVGAAVHVALPDNSAAPSAAGKLATDALQAILTKKIAAAAPLLIADAIATMQAMAAQPAIVPQATIPSMWFPNAGVRVGTVVPGQQAESPAAPPAPPAV